MNNANIIGAKTGRVMKNGHSYVLNVGPVIGAALGLGRKFSIVATRDEAEGVINLYLHPLTALPEETHAKAS